MSKYMLELKSLQKLTPNVAFIYIGLWWLNENFC